MEGAASDFMLAASSTPKEGPTAEKLGQEVMPQDSLRYGSQ
jgi:hypothetical protein